MMVVTMTGDITSWSFTSTVVDGVEFDVHFAQDATGSRLLSGKAGTILLAGGALTLTTTPGKRDILRFRRDGSGFYEVGRSMNVG